MTNTESTDPTTSVLLVTAHDPHVVRHIVQAVLGHVGEILAGREPLPVWDATVLNVNRAVDDADGQRFQDALAGLAANCFVRMIDANQVEGTLPAVSGRVAAPFDADQVAALNAYQQSGTGHPYTCGIAHGGDPGPHPAGSVLIAGPDGWTCPSVCGYEQGWAHAVHAV